MNNFSTKAAHYVTGLLFFPFSTNVLANGDTPVGSGLSYITDALLGGTGMTIATLAMMGTGLACLFHKLEWKFFGYTVAAIGIIFGAPAIVNSIVSLVR